VSRLRSSQPNFPVGNGVIPAKESVDFLLSTPFETPPKEAAPQGERCLVEFVELLSVRAEEAPASGAVSKHASAFIDSLVRGMTKKRRTPCVQ